VLIILIALTATLLTGMVSIPWFNRFTDNI
jgi:hypothetical protein